MEGSANVSGNAIENSTDVSGGTEEASDVAEGYKSCSFLVVSLDGELDFSATNTLVVIL